MTVFEDINKANIRTYNDLALSYRASRGVYRQAVYYALGPLTVHLQEQERRKGDPIRVLDMGSGAGLHTDAMSRHGFTVYAVDAAPDLLRVVSDNVPSALCIVADFWDFQTGTRFDCVIAASFIHLFPKDRLQEVMARLSSWLTKDGVIFLATVTGPSHDGEWMEKEGNHDHRKRWRVIYEEGELLRKLDSLGYEVVYRWYDPDQLHPGKTWLDMMVRPRQETKA